MLSIILQTERLLLRPPVAADISRFVPFLNDFDVTKNLSRLPHPYSEDDGCAWVVRTAGERVRGEAFPFIVMEKTEGRLIGICGVQPQLDFMLGYWFGPSRVHHLLSGHRVEIGIPSPFSQVGS